jgi:radical SAM superfamily enzyme YgiQ (UPF0313 family)
MIVFFNPRSATYKYRIPNSILSVAASIDGRYEWTIVDGNRETNPYEKIKSHFIEGAKYFAVTVMPGPQLKEAIPFSKRIKQEFPEVKIIWGGYFPSNQYKTVLGSGYVDYIINGPGDHAFPALIDALEKGKEASGIKNLIYNKDSAIVKTEKEDLIDQDSLPPLPYEKLNTIYDIPRYLGRTWLGEKTLAYHSSIGCPFTCSFCAVVPIYQARWKAKSAINIYKDIIYIKENFDADSIEFHDNNFFVSEKRTVEFADLIKDENMVWWGEGRIDTLDKYKDESLVRIRDAGCKMIFFGAETGNDEVLKKMDKGGKQTGAQILKFAERIAQFDIIPEYSFVLGTPAETPGKVMHQIDEDIRFIMKVKEANPRTEIIIYVYSPVPTEGSDLYQSVLNSGFQFPEKLEDWISPQWENFDLRKNPLTPWLTAEMVDKIKNFETVLNAYYPTVSDIKLSSFQRKAMKTLSAIRYKKNFYKWPYELKALQHYWLKYRQPEIQGF